MTDDEFLAELEAAVAKLDLPEPTPAQLAVRARNHERLIRLDREYSAWPDQ